MDSFMDIVEKVTALSLEEMQEVENILRQSSIEAKRHQVLQNKIESKTLHKEGKLKFFDSPTNLFNALNEE